MIGLPRSPEERSSARLSVAADLGRRALAELKFLAADSKVRACVRFAFRGFAVAFVLGVIIGVARNRLVGTPSIDLPLSELSDQLALILVVNVAVAARVIASFCGVAGVMAIPFAAWLASMRRRSDADPGVIEPLDVVREDPAPTTFDLYPVAEHHRRCAASGTVLPFFDAQAEERCR